MERYTQGVKLLCVCMYDYHIAVSIKRIGSIVSVCVFVFMCVCTVYMCVYMCACVVCVRCVCRFLCAHMGIVPLFSVVFVSFFFSLHSFHTAILAQNEFLECDCLEYDYNVNRVGFLCSFFFLTIFFSNYAKQCVRDSVGSWLRRADAKEESPRVLWYAHSFKRDISHTHTLAHTCYVLSHTRIHIHTQMASTYTRTHTRADGLISYGDMIIIHTYALTHAS